MQELVEQGFIQKRRQSNGRSYWLEVTDKFHQYFQTEGMNLEALIPARSQSTDNAMAESTAPAAPEVD